MTEVAATEVPADPMPPVAPVLGTTAEVEAAEAPAAPAAERMLPEIEHPIGAVRQGVLDHLLDSEGPQYCRADYRRPRKLLPQYG